MKHYIISDKFGHQIAELWADGYESSTNGYQTHFYTGNKPPCVTFWTELIEIERLP